MAETSFTVIGRQLTRSTFLAEIQIISLRKECDSWKTGYNAWDHVNASWRWREICGERQAVGHHKKPPSAKDHKNLKAVVPEGLRSYRQHDKARGKFYSIFFN